jgi:hypothetical protein
MSTKSIELARRREITESLLKNHPEHVPVSVRNNNDEKQKPLNFLAPREGTVSNILRNVRAKLNLTSTESIFLYCGNFMLPVQQSIEELYSLHHNKEDLRLYLFYARENTFGCQL